MKILLEVIRNLAQDAPHPPMQARPSSAHSVTSESNAMHQNTSQRGATTSEMGTHHRNDFSQHPSMSTTIYNQNVFQQGTLTSASCAQFQTASNQSALMSAKVRPSPKRFSTRRPDVSNGQLPPEQLPPGCNDISKRRRPSKCFPRMHVDITKDCQPSERFSKRRCDISNGCSSSNFALQKRGLYQIDNSENTTLSDARKIEINNKFASDDYRKGLDPIDYVTMSNIAWLLKQKCKSAISICHTTTARCFDVSKECQISRILPESCNDVSNGRAPTASSADESSHIFRSEPDYKFGIPHNP
uniref:Uncharacterized protein n=1 Tax=Romanomermis culicivorax TaxID=13658 RepID=A0A915L7B3_ROMCU